MQLVARSRRRFRARRRADGLSSDAAAVIPSDIALNIRTVVEARERTRNTIEQLKRQYADLDWIQAAANDLAAGEIGDNLVNSYRQVQLSNARAEEKIRACEFFLENLERLLAHYKKHNRDAVIYHLKAKVQQLTDNREAHQKDRQRLNHRIEDLLRELRELEPYTLTPVKARNE